MPSCFDPPVYCFFLPFFHARGMTDAATPAKLRAAYTRAVISPRCGDMLTDADLALLAANPDDTLPLPVADKIIVLIDRIETRLQSLVEALRPQWRLAPPTHRATRCATRLRRRRREQGRHQRRRARPAGVMRAHPPHL